VAESDVERAKERLARWASVIESALAQLGKRTLGLLVPVNMREDDAIALRLLLSDHDRLTRELREAQEALRLAHEKDAIAAHEIGCSHCDLADLRAKLAAAKNALIDRQEETDQLIMAEERKREAAEARLAELQRARMDDTTAYSEPRQLSPEGRELVIHGCVIGPDGFCHMCYPDRAARKKQ